MRRLVLVLTLILCVGSFPVGSRAAQSPATAPATSPAQRLTVAVLDFDANAPGSPDLGKQIGESVAAMLADEPAVTLVDRAALPRALQELELNLTGLTDTANAIKVGQLVGAKLLVTGRAFVLDDQLHIAAKIIGTETSLVDGVLVKGAKPKGQQAQDIAPIVDELAAKLSARLKDAGPRLVARDVQDPNATAAAAAGRQLAGRQLPVVAVRISEEMLGAAASPIDPAVQTEVTMLLKQAGFTVVEGDDRDLRRAKAEYVIAGEGLSEFAARIGNLVSCSARVELKITPLGGGEVLFADRETARATDLSQNLAAKAALQKAGRTLGVRVLEHFVKTTAAAAGGDAKDGKAAKG